MHPMRTHPHSHSTHSTSRPRSSMVRSVTPLTTPLPMVDQFVVVVVEIHTTIAHLYHTHPASLRLSRLRTSSQFNSHTPLDLNSERGGEEESASARRRRTEMERHIDEVRAELSELTPQIRSIDSSCHHYLTGGSSVVALVLSMRYSSLCITHWHACLLRALM